MVHCSNSFALFLIYNIIVAIHGKTDTAKTVVYKPKPGALGDRNIYNEMKADDLMDKVEMNFGEAVVLAREEAKCLEKFGSSTNASKNNLSTLNQGWGCFKPESVGKCELCRRLAALVIWKAEECARICMNQHSFCNKTCMKLRESLINESALYEDFFHKDKVKKNPIKESATFTSGQIIQYPHVFCEAVSKVDNTKKHDESNKNLQKEQHYVQLKWESQANSTLVYVVEQKTENMAEWEVIGKTAFANLRVNVGYHSETYRWRITAVGANGVADVADIESYKTLNGYKKPGPPKNVFVEDIAVHNLKADVTIGWEPSKENTCFYKLVMADDTAAGKVSTVRIHEPLGKHAHTFEGLSLDAYYDVRITSRSLDWTEESKAFTFYLETPSCLQIYNHSFAKCPPPPPKDVHSTITVSKDGDANLKLSWSAPEFTSPENPIEAYFVEIFHFRMKPEDYVIFRKNVEGNLTEINVINIPADLEFIAVITAFSSQGASRHAEHRFTTLNIHVFGKSTGRLLVLLALMLNLSASAVLLISFVATAMQTRRFVSLEQNRNRAVKNLYCKMRVPARKVSRAQNLPNENENHQPMRKLECSIPWENLATQEIIGQGSFATVYKAELRRNVNSTLGGETLIVALKVANEKGENGNRDDLKMEIEILRRLSIHPQIVQLIGIVMTPEREVCLVLEYCGGGNLLDYLKKIKGKYCTRLVQESGNGIEETEEEAEVESWITPNNENAEEEEFEEGKKSGESCKMLVGKGMLACARQIAMGMEYLASFNLLHRDLAARNILLMDDFRSVKIADFGLSRFITDLENGEIGESTFTNLPIRWLALEAITSGIFSTKSDVWSFGILLWEMVTFGSVPYSEIEDDEKLVGYLQDGPDCRLGKPDFCSDELYGVMIQCWRENHNERPTFSQLRDQIEKLMEKSMNNKLKILF